jgi:branched-chain amino acid transport system ATP-binding protein
MVAIIGPNGAGKSTLLKAIAGLLPLKSGAMLFDGGAIQHLSPGDRARRGIAFVPQEANVFPSMTVRENLEMGGLIEHAGIRARIDALLERFPMLADKRRALARLLLLDEPSAGLSPAAAEILFDTIVDIHRTGTSIVMVEQNAREALMIADRGVVLVDGRTVRDGPARAMAEDPEVRRLFLGG